MQGGDELVEGTEAKDGEAGMLSSTGLDDDRSQGSNSSRHAPIESAVD